MEIRTLTEDDAAEYQAVRLRSLQEHPEAFGASYEEEKGTPLERVADQLKGSPSFGAFVEGNLIGIASLFRFPRAKSRHRAILGGMYVCPEARGQGAGTYLLNETIRCARDEIQLEDMILAVTVGNETARNLYIKAGFIPFGVDPRYIKINDQYFDIEWMILPLKA